MTAPIPLTPFPPMEAPGLFAADNGRDLAFEIFQQSLFPLMGQSWSQDTAAASFGQRYAQGNAVL